MQFVGTNGKFALVRTYDSANNKTYVTVIDNGTGTVVDAPIEMNGDAQDFNDNGISRSSVIALIYRPRQAPRLLQQRNWRSSTPTLAEWSPRRRSHRRVTRKTATAS